jgi:hypothetical protein
MSTVVSNQSAVPSRVRRILPSGTNPTANGTHDSRACPCRTRHVREILPGAFALLARQMGRRLR